MPDAEEAYSPGYSEGPFDPRIERQLVALKESFTTDWAAFSARAPDPLWHYTDAEGFRGIVTNGTFRFSHTRLLNDPTEIVQGWSLVISELEAEIASQEHLSEFYTMTRDVADQVHSTYHYFIFSLSAREDSLSQWRAYGSGGSGYSLGLASGQLGRERQDGDFALVRLIYGEKDHRKIIHAAIKRTRYFFQRIIALNPSKQDQAGIVHRANVSLAHYLMRVSLLFKDSSFEDEQEWRLVVGYSPNGGAVEEQMLKTVLFRCAGGLVRPYFDFDFRYEGDEEGGRLLPLRVVRYGPTLRPTSTEFSIRFLLDRRAYIATKIKKSDVPLEA